MNKKYIGIIFGGKSEEYLVSCISASSILDNIDTDKYNIVKIGIDRQGQWFKTCGTSKEIRENKWIDEEKFPLDIKLVGNKGLYHLDKKIELDCILSTLHGNQGEDGKIQGLFDVLDIKYVGSNTLSSAMCMDKAISKKVVESLTDVKQIDFLTMKSWEFATSPLEKLNSIEKYFKGKYPLFIKPANGGSSIGISKVYDINELFEGIKKAFEIDEKILIERGVVAREVEVAVMGRKNPKASKVGEIISSNKELYDYDAKYLSGQSIMEIPANIDEEIANKIRDNALKVYNALECKDLARVDFFLTENDEIIFNEVNTLPGFTENSMYPRLWESTGISYMELIDKIIEFGMEE